MVTEVHTPRSSESARDEIERTRARMSETIDEIEDVILRRKADLRERLDVGARLRERPLQVVGIALGAGLFLGLLTGGRSSREKRSKRELDERENRAARWEKRARRLLTIARSQEDRIDKLESAVDELGELYGSARYDDDELDDLPSRFSELRESVAARVEDAAAATAARFRETLGRGR